MDNIMQYLEEQISQLKQELSVTIPQEIKEAVELGDLRENTEYSSALERQNLVGIRLEQLLRRAEAYRKIDISTLPRDAVNIGSIVKVRNLKTNKIEHFKIVLGDIDETESKDHQEVTIASPIGQAMKNKKVKDEILVSTPRGVTKYRILQIKTAHTL
jgi:transcription elongation factor GreA